MEFNPKNRFISSIVGEGHRKTPSSRIINWAYRKELQNRAAITAESITARQMEQRKNSSNRSPPQRAMNTVAADMSTVLPDVCATRFMINCTRTCGYRFLSAVNLETMKSV